MCGRYTLTVDPADLQDAFPGFTFPAQVSSRYNIAPGQPILVVPNDGMNHATFFKWGLIPSWAKDPSIGNRMINARGETLAEKPSFRNAYKYRRCLIFADGFYEWQAHPGSGSKVPHLIKLSSNRPFAFAGLWERWQPADGSEVLSATIITTHPNQLVSKIHDRMPVILRPDAYAKWLDPTPLVPDRLHELLAPFPAEEMVAHPVSNLVNSPTNDQAECILPV